MQIQNNYNTPLFQSRCPEIRLGQDVCHLVNTQFPHYSLFKFKPMIEKNITKTTSPANVQKLIMQFNLHRPHSYNPESYIPDLFNFINKYKNFNCQESAMLAELILKLNGIKNSCAALIRDGEAKGNHVVCLFNKDGSEVAIDENGRIKNNKTIIVDPWADICDFANNVLKEYHCFWKEHFKPDYVYTDKATGIYNITQIRSMDFSDEFLNRMRTCCPNLVLKNIQ